MVALSQFDVHAVQVHPAHGWRFVSKYANRSGGGFPIFSEERIKERAEKVT